MSPPKTRPIDILITAGGIAAIVATPFIFAAAGTYALVRHLAGVPGHTPARLHVPSSCPACQRKRANQERPR